MSVVLAGPCGLLLNVTGNERWMARATVISVAVAAVAIYPAASSAGAIGAAIVMAGSTVLRVALQLLYARRQTGIATHADFPAFIRSIRPGGRQP